MFPAVQVLHRYEFSDRQTNISADLAKQCRRDVSGPVHRNRGHAAIGMPELLMRAALANLHESQTLKPSDDLAGLKNRDRTHGARATRREWSACRRTLLREAARRPRGAWQ